MSNMKNANPDQSTAFVKSPVNWRKELEAFLDSNSPGLQYWQEDGLSEGYFFDIHAWSMAY